MHSNALIILVHLWNCEYFAGSAESGMKHFRQLLQTVEIRLDDVVPNACAR